ncbi:MAG: hypothetical protein AAB360_00785 [Patescibacteria group bacterium]
MSQFSTQQSIDIAGIKEGVVILKNGGYRLIFSVAAINFALKSEQEQNSIIFQYQSFLNSLHFPIQIVMRSKRLDLDPYLQKVSKLAGDQQNELLRIQTEDYVDFVGKLINIANIMKKTFYAVIPYQPLSLQNTGALGKLFRREKTVTELKISETEFNHNIQELKQRAGVVASGLGSMGLRCVQLSTEEVIELFYQVYNPEEAGTERVSDAESLTSPVVIHKSEAPEEAGGQRPEGEGDNTAESLRPKAEGGQAEGERPEAESQREEVIDNSASVLAQQKEQAMLHRQEMMKEGERNIAQGQRPEAEDDNTPNPPPATPEPITQTPNQTTTQTNQPDNSNPEEQDETQQHKPQ